MAVLTAYTPYSIDLYDTSALLGYTVKTDSEYTVRSESGRENTFRGDFTYENDYLNGRVTMIEQTNEKRTTKDFTIEELDFDMAALRKYVTDTADYIGLPFFFRGSDTLNGSIGKDVISAYDGNDAIYGNAGNDTLNGDKGKDKLYGGAGADIIYGDLHGDRLFGEAGNDKLFGGQGSDILSGGKEDDRLKGDAGADRLSGNEGADGLNGGEGADRLYGGQGNDQLIGGGGKDYFIFGKEDLFKSLGGTERNYNGTKIYKNADLIRDFKTDIDILQIRQAIAGTGNSLEVSDLNFRTYYHDINWKVREFEETHITFKSKEGFLSVRVNGVVTAGDIQII